MDNISIGKNTNAGYALDISGSINTNGFQTNTGALPTITPTINPMTSAASGSTYTVGTFTVPANTTAQYIQVITPISAYINAKSTTNGISSSIILSLSGITYSIITSPNLSISNPTVSSSNGYKNYTYTNSSPVLYNVKQYLTTASCNFTTPYSTSSVSYTVKILLTYSLFQSGGTQNGSTLYINSTVSGTTFQSTSTTAKQTAASGYLPASISISSQNSISTGVMACNSLIVNNLYYRSMTSLPPLTSVKASAGLTAINQAVIDPIASSTSGYINGTSGNDNYSYWIIGDVSGNVNYTCGYITIPENTTYMSIQGYGGGGGGGGGAIYSNMGCDLTGGGGGGGSSYCERTYNLMALNLNSSRQIWYSVGSGGSGGCSGLSFSTNYLINHSGTAGSNGGDTNVYLDGSSGLMIFQTKGGVGGSGGTQGRTTTSGGANGAMTYYPTTIYNNSTNTGGSSSYNAVGGNSSNTFFSNMTGGGGGGGVSWTNGTQTVYSGGSSGTKNGLPPFGNGVYGYGSSGYSSQVGNVSAYSIVSNSNVDYGGGGGGSGSYITTDSAYQITNNYLTFNGTSQYAQVAAATSYAYTTGTIECWIKTATTTQSGIFSKQGAYSMYILATGKIGFYNYGTTTMMTGNTTVNNGAWHHIAIVFQSGVSNGTVIYVDGVADVSPFTFTTSAQTGILSLGIISSGNQFFNGSIAEPRIWSVARTALQIQYNYKIRLLSNTIPDGQWLMSEGTGTTLSNNAIMTTFSFTLSGSPTWNTTGGPVIYTDNYLTATVSSVNFGDNGGTGGLFIQFF